MRELFYAHGVVTTTLPSSGGQNEFDVNKLLEHTRAPEILGAELLYDLRVLLTEKAGGNLRNALAHGLLDDGDATGAKIYFWWTCLRMAIFPIAMAERQGEQPDDRDPRSE